MAYDSDESGTYEVYVRPFGHSQAQSSQGGPGGKWQISSGALDPVWSGIASGGRRELFYAIPDDKLMVSEYTAKGDSFTYPKPLLWADKALLGGSRPYFDIAPDGKRFAVFARPDAEERLGNVHVTFLLNFFDEVARKVPVGK
jgi:hypothetical protein